MCIAIVYYGDQTYLSLTIDWDTFAPADIAPLIPARSADMEKKGPGDRMSDQKLLQQRRWEAVPQERELPESWQTQLLS